MTDLMVDLPEHLPMFVNEAGEGPFDPNRDEGPIYLSCWCRESTCMLGWVHLEIAVDPALFFTQRGVNKDASIAFAQERRLVEANPDQQYQFLNATNRGHLRVFHFRVRRRWA